MGALGGRGERREGGGINWRIVPVFLVGVLCGVLLREPAKDPMPEHKREALVEIAARNKLRAEDHGNIDRVAFAELFDIPAGFIEAVDKAENGEPGYQMGQKSVHPSVWFFTEEEKVAQEIQAARTLNRFAWRFLLANPALGVEYTKAHKKANWEQERFLMEYKTRYIEFMAKYGWPDPKVDNCDVWAYNMRYFVAKWERQHR